MPFWPLVAPAAAEEDSVRPEPAEPVSGKAVARPCEGSDALADVLGAASVGGFSSILTRYW